MDPIWQTLPDDVALHVISFLDDIDTRRAFGFKPRKLPPMDLPPFRPTFTLERFNDNYSPTLEKYISETHTRIRMKWWGYESYVWEVFTDMTWDPERRGYMIGPTATIREFHHNQDPWDLNSFLTTDWSPIWLVRRWDLDGIIFE
jgi:hypothetical protein